ncbi:hypothetical protein [Spirosoma aerophilum]
MPSLFKIGDSVIVMTTDSQLINLEVIDIDMRRESKQNLTAIYWLSDGRAYQRADLFVNAEEAKGANRPPVPSY